MLHGLENVTPGQPFILVANHVSWFDIFAIAAKLPVDYHFVAKKELEKIPVFGLAWRAAGHISIDRGNRESAAQSLRKAGQQMREQKSVVVIFAEGTRSRSGRLQPFKKGAFVLAAETGIPVIPTVVTGSYDIMRPDTFIVRPATIHVYFEPPIPAQGSSVDALMQRTRAVFVERLEETESLPPDDPEPAPSPPARRADLARQSGFPRRSIPRPPSPRSTVSNAALVRKKRHLTFRHRSLIFSRPRSA